MTFARGVRSLKGLVTRSQFTACWAVCAVACAVVGSAHGAAYGQGLAAIGAPLNSGQGTTLVLLPADGDATVIVRQSRIAPNGHSVLACTFDGGIEYGRPDLTGGIDFTATVRDVVMFSASAGFDCVGEGSHSELGLPGDRADSYLGAVVGLRPLPGLICDVRLDHASAGAMRGSATAVGMSLRAALASRLVVSAAGTRAGIATLGFTWQPMAGGYLLSGTAATGTGPLSALFEGREPDSRATPLSLSFTAPMSAESSLRIGFASGSNLRAVPSLDTSKFTAIITRNL